ncbi:MAG: hypothetical protein MI923_16115 [Phycisphaerales bacterium]|nr:hypothetical protein [Phycisphaerales bacterium]
MAANPKAPFPPPLRREQKGPAFGCADGKTTMVWRSIIWRLINLVEYETDHAPGLVDTIVADVRRYVYQRRRERRRQRRWHRRRQHAAHEPPKPKRMRMGRPDRREVGTADP